MKPVEQQSHEPATDLAEDPVDPRLAAAAEPTEETHTVSRPAHWAMWSGEPRRIAI
jgi:hypothetical protein